MAGIEIVGVDVDVGGQLADLAPTRRRSPRWRTSPGCAPSATSAGSTSAAGSEPRTPLDEAPPLPFDYGEVIGAERRSPRLRDRDRAGKADRRQRRGAALPRDLAQGRRGARLPDPGRGDQRPPRPSGDAATSSRWRRRRPSRRGRSGRSASPATPSPSPGRCRRSTPATSSPSARPAPTARSTASEYNSRPLVPEVLVSGDRHAVVRARELRRNAGARHGAGLAGELASPPKDHYAVEKDHYAVERCGRALTKRPGARSSAPTTDGGPVGGRRGG